MKKMKNGKKYLTGLVLLILILSLCGCGKEKKELAADTKEETNAEIEKSKAEEKKDDTSKKEEAAANADAKEEDETEAEPIDAEKAVDPVSGHGKLSVKGTQLVDKAGKPYQLMGVSTHGLNWFPEYVNKDCFQTMKEEWGINCVRLAMYTAEGNSYCEGGNKEELKTVVNNGVDYATELGLYVIIDWHILHDLDPNKYKADALAFFEEMSKKYADNDNVLYEICNEPNGGTSWESVKAYAEEVIPVIKKNDPNAIIIVGTPTWSQDVDLAAQNPITGYDNIMYTIHFYADTHRDAIRDKMKKALQAGVPVFCTEFGICDASGNGVINTEEANKWIDEMNANGVSYCIWNLSNKDESSSLIKSSCSKLSGWTEDELSREAVWYLEVLKKSGQAVKAVGESAKASEQTKDEDAKPESAQNEEAANSGETDKKGEQKLNGKSGKFSVEATLSNSWSDGKAEYSQYEVTITATGGAVNGWTATMSFGETVQINQSWNGSFRVNGDKLIVTPADYNKEVGDGGTVSFGVIVNADSPVTLKSVTIE